MAEQIRTCVFDAYGTLLDVNAAVMASVEDIGPDAEVLAQLWRSRQLEYCWTRSMMNRYADFAVVTEEALMFALRMFGLEGRAGLKDLLMSSYFELGAHPETLDALSKLKKMGIRNAVLSNGTEAMLHAALKAGGLLDHVDVCLSIDDLKIYKPDPRVYQMACDRLNVAAKDVCFVSCNCWDLAGASSFGFNAVRINRQNLPPEYEFAPLYSEQNSLLGLVDLLR